jgi:hypothetical protein
MKRQILTGVRAGTLAIALAALATPVLAQGQGGVKSDSTAENPSTKTGHAGEMNRAPKPGSSATTGSKMRNNTQTPQQMQDAKKNDINSSGAGGGGGGGGGGGR